jgi:predicted DNA-binding protein
MKRRKSTSANINFSVEPELKEKYEKVCSRTGETKIDLFRRMTENEFNITEGNYGDVKSAMPSILEKKLDNFKEDLFEQIGMVLHLLELACGASLYANKGIAKSMMWANRSLIDGFKIPEETIEKRSNMVDQNSTTYFNNMLDVVQAGLENTIDFLKKE